MKYLALFLALALLSAPLAAIDAKDGLMKISLIESAGRFNVFFLQDVAKESYIPFLFERDPRTSSSNVLLDGRLHRLGESADFKMSARAVEGGLEYSFKSPSCTIIQTFLFTTSPGSVLADGVLLRMSIENTSERDISAGLRIILDTYLGERSGTHFASDTKPKISAETLLTDSYKERYLISPQQDSESVGMKIYLNSGSRPDSIIMANWSRLNSSPWNFSHDPSRNFTLQPYSINDSAIALNFDAQTIGRAKSRQVEIYIGNRSSLEPAANLDAGATDTKAIDARPMGAGEASASKNIQADLMAVRELLERINGKLSSGASISAEERKAMEETLSRLKARKPVY